MWGWKCARPSCAPFPGPPRDAPRGRTGRGRGREVGTHLQPGLVPVPARGARPRRRLPLRPSPGRVRPGATGKPRQRGVHGPAGLKVTARLSMQWEGVGGRGRLSEGIGAPTTSETPAEEVERFRSAGIASHQGVDPHDQEACGENQMRCKGRRGGCPCMVVTNLAELELFLLRRGPSLSDNEADPNPLAPLTLGPRELLASTKSFAPVYNVRLVLVPGHSRPRCAARTGIEGELACNKTDPSN